jgi:cytochrome c-type biogenesis protein CcmE
MDPAKKRQIRLVLALSAAVLLAVALIYTSFNAANEAIEPSELLAAEDAGTVVLTGKVAEGTEKRTESGVNFAIHDREAEDPTVPVEYQGVVPDPFREGREVIVTGTLAADGTFMAEKDSLITKCPSKFEEEYGDDPNVQIEES